MKTALTFILLLFFLFNAEGQSKEQNSCRIQIDTLNMQADSILANVLTFNNGFLIEEKTAFLFPDSIHVPRFKFTGNLFKKTVYVSRLLKHGETVEYRENGNKKKTHYKYNKIINTFYSDKDNKEIAKDEFDDGKIPIGPCGIMTGEYIILGEKK